MASTVTNVTAPLDRPAIQALHYVELYVGNVRQAAHYYKTVWGFAPVAVRGLEEGVRDRKSMVLQQAQISLVLTGAVASTSEVAEHLRLHGEGVAAIAFRVTDASAAFDYAVIKGARSVSPPTCLEDEHGHITQAKVYATDAFSHIFIDCDDYGGVFLPGFQPIARDMRKAPKNNAIVRSIDHLAIAVDAGTLQSWVDFYEHTLGFKLVKREDVSTELTGMMSRVVEDPKGICKFPLVEPLSLKKRSQIDEFLGYHNGPGVQHLGLQTRDICATVSELRERGVDFVPIPAGYYEDLGARSGLTSEEVSKYRDCGILVDRDDDGYLLQTFVRPNGDRPTFFIELVERKGSTGFGAKNIRALFRAIEQEQALRGTL